MARTHRWVADARRRVRISRAALASASAGVLIATGLVAFATPGASAVGGLSSARIVSMLNAQREAAGLPPVQLRKDWSSACAAHNQWMQLNGTMSHTEDPGTPGYSAAGQWAAGNSVLAATSWRDGNPFQFAPLHLSQLLSPWLTEVGASENDGHTCVTTWPGYHASLTSKAAFYWYPPSSDQVAPNEVARETPTVPQTWVGIPAGQQTGPHLFVYYSGALLNGTKISGSITGPNGKVKTAVITDQTGAKNGYPGLLAATAILLPRSPLEPHTNYTATIRVGGHTSVFRFKTGDWVSQDRHQSIAFTRSSLKKGTTVALPKKTKQGIAVVWSSRTPSVCVVKARKVVKVRKVGTCRLDATARATPALAGLTVKYRLPVKRK